MKIEGEIRKKLKELEENNEKIMRAQVQFACRDKNVKVGSWRRMIARMF